MPEHERDQGGLSEDPPFRQVAEVGVRAEEGLQGLLDLAKEETIDNLVRHKAVDLTRS